MPKRFPAIAGGCFCGLVRYRILTSPLFCYACHCTDCQKQTGSVFGCYATMEVDLIGIISANRPAFVREMRRNGSERIHAECASCKTELWSNDSARVGIVEVNIGTLDYPGLMEPDLHSYVESKVDWVILPPGARTCPKGFEIQDVWPKSSLKRLEAGVKRYKEALLKREAALAGAKAGDAEREDEHREKEGDKTPTAVEPEGKELEDDEEFERRYKETEKALQERLAKLSLKLEEEEGGKLDAQSTKEPVEKEGTDARGKKESVEEQKKDAQEPISSIT